MCHQLIIFFINLQILICDKNFIFLYLVWLLSIFNLILVFSCLNSPRGHIRKLPFSFIEKPEIALNLVWLKVGIACRLVHILVEKMTIQYIFYSDTSELSSARFSLDLAWSGDLPARLPCEIFKLAFPAKLG